MTTQEPIVEKKKDRRYGKGVVIAISRQVYRIINTDAFYVESESIDGMYYYVVFNTDKGLEWCSCRDHERNGYRTKCKHLFAIEYSIRKGTVKDTDKLPVSTVKTDDPQKLQYERDDYGF
jgi:hypothetical protein